MTARRLVAAALGLAAIAAAQSEKLSLFDLVDRGNTEPRKVRALLAAGANPNMPGQRGLTPLAAAIDKYDLPVARVLVEAGADVNPTVSTYDRPLFRAMSKSEDLFQFLLNKGADPNVPDADGRTPLHFIVEYGGDTDEKAAMLIAAGAKVNASDSRGNTPLMATARTNRYRLAQLLIRKGADVNAKDHSGNTALMIARSERMKEILTAAAAAPPRKR